jgi:hypothetical protein
MPRGACLDRREKLSAASSQIHFLKGARALQWQANEDAATATATERAEKQWANVSWR